MTNSPSGSLDDPNRKLRHDLANPLSAILAEAQLLLMGQPLDAETEQSIKEIERLSRRMRDILQESSK